VLVNVSDTVTFDPFSRAYFDDPTEMYRQLVEQDPVHWSEKYGFWALSRWDDVADASKDWATFSSAYGITIEQIVAHRRAEMESIIMIDPPRHDRLRSLVSRVFTPKAVTSLEPMVREVISEVYDALGDRTSFDVIQDVSGPFPVEIISRMLGVPEADRQMIRHQLDIALTRDEGEMHTTEQGLEAFVVLGTYFYELVVEKRRLVEAGTPGDDMLTGLVQAEYEDEHGELQKLDDVEIAGFATLLGGAGAETVTKLVGNAAVLFHRNPDQWQLVLDDRGTIPGAIEEILRYYPPSQYQGRYAVQDWTRHGVTIPANSGVILLTGAATRDPRAYPDPDRFDITREPKLALGFGYGVHSCLGAALARLEGRLAIEELAARYPKFRVLEDGLTRVQMSNVAGFATVPVEIG
jgi:cytochrome P450